MLQHWTVDDTTNKTQTTYTSNTYHAQVRANKNGFWIPPQFHITGEERSELEELFKHGLGKIEDYRKVATTPVIEAPTAAPAPRPTKADPKG